MTKNVTPPNPSRPISGRAALTPFDFALYACVVLVWGLSWLPMQFQVNDVAPEVSVLWRFCIAAPIMATLTLIRGESLLLPPRVHLLLVGLGATLFCTNFTLFYYASQYLTSGLLAVVFSLASVINVALGALTLGAPIDRRVAVGGLFGVLGIALMFTPEIARADFGVMRLVGLALSVGGTLSFCCGNMISAHLSRGGLSIFPTSAWGMLYGAIILAIVSLFRGHAFIIEWTPLYLGSLLYLAIVASVGAFASYLTLLSRIGPDRAAYATVLLPVVGLLVSTFAEDYRWTWPAILGLVAVTIGNVLVLRPVKKTIPPPQPPTSDSQGTR